MLGDVRNSFLVNDRGFKVALVCVALAGHLFYFLAAGQGHLFAQLLQALLGACVRALASLGNALVYALADLFRGRAKLRQRAQVNLLLPALFAKGLVKAVHSLNDCFGAIGDGKFPILLSIERKELGWDRLFGICL